MERKKVWNENQEYLAEWNKLFDLLGAAKEDFIKLIDDNEFSLEKLCRIKDSIHKKLFIHYLTITNLLKALNLDDTETKDFIVYYIHDEFGLIYQRLVKYVAENKISYSNLKGIYSIFKSDFVKDVFNRISFSEKEEPFVIKNLIRVQYITQIHVFEYELVRCFYMYKSVDFLGREKEEEIIQAIRELDERRTRDLLLEQFDRFRNKVVLTIPAGEVGAKYILSQVEDQLNAVYRQLSLFDL